MMVNYKRVVCEVALLAALAVVVAGAPSADHDTHYDQRQNGSENYRLNIDGVVIAVAPADSLLAAASDIDIGDLLELYDLDEHKPKPPASAEAPLKPPTPDAKPPASDSKPDEASAVKPEPPAKPDELKPEAPAKPADSPLSDVSLDSVKGHKKDASTRKQENAHRLRNKIAHLLLPLLRRNKHH